MKPTTLQTYRERILRVLVHVQQQLDGELALEQLAEVAGFSAFHFHRIFRGMVGEALAEHVRRLRLERAAQRLKQTGRPVVRIAFEAGYETHEAFTRAFRALFGEAPSRFRKQRRPTLVGAAAPSGVHYGAQLDSFGDTGETTMDVQIETRRPTRVAFMRHVGPYSECGPTWDTFVPSMGAQGWLGGDAQFLGVCHDDPDVTPADKLRYDCCVSVDESYQPEGDVGVQVLAGGDYARTTHQGPYERLGQTYAELFGRWLPRSGRLPAASPCLEVYLNDPHGTEPEELLTDIYLPLEPLR